MNIKSETGMAVNILVALGSVSDGYTRPELIKKTKLNTTKCCKTLTDLEEHRLIDTDKTDELESKYIYRIAKPADMITLNEIFTIYEGSNILNGVCLFCGRGCRRDESIEKCSFAKKMMAYTAMTQKWMQAVTIQDLILAGDDYFERMFERDAAKKKSAAANRKKA